jgi:SecD/SecF fusion protein
MRATLGAWLAAILACGCAPAPTLPVVLTADPPGSQADADADASVLVARLAAVGGSGAIDAAAPGRLALRTGGTRPIADVLAPGALSFHVVDEPATQAAMLAAYDGGGPALAPVPAGRIRAVQCTTSDDCESLTLHPAFLSPGHIADAVAKPAADTASPSVAITFDAEGRAAFAAATAANVGKRIAVVLDGQVWSAPKIMSPIRGGQLMIEAYSPGFDDAQRLAALLDGGPLRRTWTPAHVGP